MTVHFPKPGDYSEEIFTLVNKRLELGDINQIIIATTSGKTALKAAKAFEGIKLIAVTHQAGFREPGEMEIPAEAIQELESKDVTVVTATHALAGVDRAVRKKHGTWLTAEIMAETLRIFGQGTKVCAEIVVMAADAGVISMNDVIVIGGTGKGADTAWVVKPAHSSTFFHMKMKELLCKPE